MFIKNQIFRKPPQVFRADSHTVLSSAWALIQYKDDILPVQEIPLWR